MRTIAEYLVKKAWGELKDKVTGEMIVDTPSHAAVLIVKNKKKF